MADDAAIQKDLEMRTGWKRQNRQYHVTELGKDIGSDTHALYVLAHHARVKLAKYGVDDQTLLTVGDLAQKHPPPASMGNGGNSNGGSVKPAPARRKLSTVMFLDIVGSTQLRSDIGNWKYSRLMTSYRNSCDRILSRHGGRLIKWLGDGFLATFTLPTNAVNCGLDLAGESETFRIGVRVGLHASEIMTQDGDIDGLGVHIASRIETAATPGQVWVSQTVKGALAGSPFSFESVGVKSLKGVDGDWELFVVSG